MGGTMATVLGVKNEIPVTMAFIQIDQTPNHALQSTSGDLLGIT